MPKRKYGGADSSHPGEVAQGVYMGITAPGGVGKTTLIGTLAHPFDPDELEWLTDIIRPHTSPLLIWDDNSNTVVLPDSEYIDTVRINRTSIIDNTLSELERGEHQHLKSLVWDNVSASYDRKFTEWGASGPKNQDQRSWWGVANSWVTVTTRRMLNLAQGPRQLNVFFIFQEAQIERVVTDPNSGGFVERRRKEPSMSDKIQTQWGSMVPFLGFLYTADDNVDPAPRVLDFRAVSYSLGKKQVPLNARMKLIPGMVWNPDLGHLVNVLHGLEEWNTAKHTRVIKKKSYSTTEPDENEEQTDS